MGVFIEPSDYVLGLNQIEQYTYRSAPEGSRSQPGDLDLTIYSLKKYVRLAAKGNPSILCLLFVPEDMCSIKRIWGSLLQSMSGRFISKKTIRQYIGYMTAQKERLFGERGQKRVNRPELVEKYGYDTKYAMHCLRLGFQGKEIASGKLTFPMEEPIKTLLQDIRTGQYKIDFVRSVYETLLYELEQILKGDLPDEPDIKSINKFLEETYLDYWTSHYR